ncbi:MAG: DUF4252 domain-containing protein [Reichenbachiella sp.]|uniref:DUF4252 domain-containing protein n=2 Tax=Reichenbachiella sp. TaxID=2184521 RepID=UPI0032995E60
MIDINIGQILNYSALYPKGRVLLLSLALLFMSIISYAQSSTITDLKKERLTSMDLHFYPSTLRMVNLDNNEEFNRLIQDIEKLIFFKMNGKFENIDLYNLVNQLQSNEDFEEYVVVEGPTKKFYLLGREKPTETVGIALLDNEHYVFDVAGSLELKELPKLYQYISENDSTFQNKFSSILGLMEMGDDIAD